MPGEWHRGGSVVAELVPPSHCFEREKDAVVTHVDLPRDAEEHAAYHVGGHVQPPHGAMEDGGPIGAAGTLASSPGEEMPNARPPAKT